MTTYKVVFSGELQPGKVPDEVRDAFSAKFKVRAEKAEKLFRSKKEVVLKDNLDEEKAEKFCMALEKLGMVVRLEANQPAVSYELKIKNTESDDTEATQIFDSTKVGLTATPNLPKCPKCGSSNMHQGICQDCGIVAEKYLARHTTEAEDDAEGEEIDLNPPDDNPYAPPEADLYEPGEGEMTGPSSVPAGHGMAWISQGWWYVKQNPFAWIGAVLLWFVVAILVSLIPLVGSIVINLVTPVFTAGFLVGCRAQDDGEPFTVGHLFAGFSNNPGQLVLMGLIYFGAMVALMIVMMMLIFGGMGLSGMDPENPEMMINAVASPMMIVWGILLLLLMVPLMMAYLFAPALIALEDMTAFAAMKMSFSGSLKNLLPLTLYGLLAIVLIIVGSLTFGLGLLIVIPLLTASIYAAYKDIYYS